MSDHSAFGMCLAARARPKWQAAIGMAQAKHQRGLRAIAGNPDHDPIRGALPLDLDPAG
jgi:hypothetical protein